jgi:hypothetical protein
MLVLVGFRFLFTAYVLLLLEVVEFPPCCLRTLRTNSMLAEEGASLTTAPPFDARKMAWREAGMRQVILLVYLGSGVSL